MKIVKGRTNAILKAVSKPVDRVTKKVQKLIRDMEPAMFDANGIGLAAPQIGLNTRVVLCLLDGEKVVPMVNPEITWRSEETETHEEGCLSLPGVWGPTERYLGLRVRYLDQSGRLNEIRLDGLNARIVQHELDHLNGVLFIDRSEGNIALNQTFLPA